MKAIAPGKLILSGEHAVVYGRPALAMAVNRHAESIIRPEALEEVQFDLTDLCESERFTLRALRELKTRVYKNYQQFLEGRLGIREVLHKPVELFEFAFINLLDGLHLKVEKGLNIKLHSTIPIGCGMGSSAATILCVLRAIGHYFRVEFRPDWYLNYSIEAEKLQHGYSSGVDPYISLHGGCARFQQGQAKQMPLPRAGMYLVQTGAPQVTTGECVSHVRAHTGENAAIWNDFEAVTNAVEQALAANDRRDIRDAIRENHKLLTKIGVVPEKVQNFIRDVEAAGYAAKTCGAGAVTGDSAGMVLVFADRQPDALCKTHGYTALTIHGDPLGVRVV
ncbi:MAG: mevalonate kinase [Verrucomicrobia bacterium]|nr:MAG: mevalonate kinase [Verrucomicrobiota bacterium]